MFSSFFVFCFCIISEWGQETGSECTDVSLSTPETTNDCHGEVSKKKQTNKQTKQHKSPVAKIDTISALYYIKLFMWVKFLLDSAG